MLDRWTNNGFSSIDAAMNSTQTTLNVTASTGSRFPVDNFQLRIWNAATFANPIDDPNNEIVRCTSRAGDVLTITRGQEGTTAVTHSLQDSVALVITQKFRDDLEKSTAKAWVKFNAAGTIAASHNVASITDNGTGNWTVNIDTDFSSANYAGVVMVGRSTLNGHLVADVIAQAAGTFQIQVTASSDGGTLSDANLIDACEAVFFGDQA